jgi:undecaprenyl-diphosphatase
MLIYQGAGLAASLVVLLLLAEFHEEIVKPLVEGWDHGVQAWVHAHASATLTPVMKALTEIGAPRTIYPLCALIFGLLWWRGQRREAGLLASSMVGSEVLVGALKLHFKRARPDVPWRWGHEHSYSFPSGHSVMAVVLYGTLLYLGLRWLDHWWARVLACVFALGMALSIGYSRIYLGAHWPSDVLAGYLCGCVWLGTLVLADVGVRGELRRWRRG